MENQMTRLQCRKCGATVSADQKKCPKCGAPILLKVMMEEEKRHLPAKEIREKDKRMRQEYAKMNKEKELERQKAEKKKQKLEEKAEKKRQKAKSELEAIHEKDEKKAKVEAERALKQAEKEEQKAQKATEKADKKLAKSEKKNKAGLIIGIIVVVLVIVGAAAVLFLTRSYDKQAEPSEEPEITETVTETEITEEPEVQEEQVEEPTEPETPAEPEPTPEVPQEPVKEETPKRNITRNNYLFPSDTQYLTESDLSGLSKFDTGLIRNEIFARKGYVFKNEPYKSYFNSQAWYNPNASAKIKLNDIEKYNNEFILAYERSQGWR